MNRAILKNITFAVIVVIVGVVLRSIDTLSQERIWRWSLGDLVGWASFTAAAAIAAYLAGEVGSRQNRPVLNSPALSRLLAIVALGVGLWLLQTAVKPVITSAWVDIEQKVFAFGIVALAGYALWVAHQGFDEIARALAPARPQAGVAQTHAPTIPPAQARAMVAEGRATPPAPAQAATQCPRCGATNPGGQRFCGTCGTAITVQS